MEIRVQVVQQQHQLQHDKEEVFMDCKIVNSALASSVEKINGIAGKYAQAGANFETAFKNAISTMEGDTKDALVEIFDKKYKEFVNTQISDMITGLATLLNSNRENFEQVDEQIARNRQKTSHP